MKDLLSITALPKYAITHVVVHIDGAVAEEKKLSYPEVLEACKAIALATVPGSSHATAHEVSKDKCKVRIRVPLNKG